MLNYFRKLIYILSASFGELCFAISLFIFSSFIEAIGIGIVGPYIAIASDFTLIDKQVLLSAFQEFVGIEQDNLFVALIGLIVIFIFLAKTIISWATQVFVVKFGDKQQRLLISKVADKYLCAPYQYHIKKSSSTIVARLVEISNTFSNTIFIPLFSTLSNIFLFFALLSLLCFTSLPIVIFLLVILVPSLLAINSFAPKIRKWGKEIHDAKASIIRIVNYAFGSVKEMKTIGCEQYFSDKLIYQAKKLENSHRTFVSFKIIPRFALEGLLVVSTVSIIALTLIINSQGVGNITAVIGVFALALIRLLPATTNSINGINQLRLSSYTLDQIYRELQELSDAVSDTHDFIFHHDSPFRPTRANCRSLEQSSRETIQFSNQIRLNDISYNYPGSSKEVISHLSLNIRKGDSIALIGKSGAGKTTLVDIILGLLTPINGDILIDEKFSIYNHLDSWKNLIAYIPQSIFLADDSVKHNIAFGVPDHLVDDKKLERAIRAAQLVNVVDELPNGVETLVGEKGILLSGGQRQRIGIARALYHDREILVLDEATSALDNETEKQITDSIASLSSDKKVTLITIAHRLSTIKHCDMVYVLSDGKIINSGSYSEVVGRDSVLNK